MQRSLGVRWSTPLEYPEVQKPTKLRLQMTVDRPEVNSTDKLEILKAQFFWINMEISGWKAKEIHNLKIDLRSKVLARCV